MLHLPLSKEGAKPQAESHESSKGKDIESAEGVDSLVLLHYLPIELEPDSSKHCHYQALQVASPA